MPCDYSKYPINWRTVSLTIRTKRAGHICECEGECGLNHAAELTEQDAEVFAELDITIQADRCHAMQKADHPITGSRVVLTVAHLCECEPLCAEPAHLKAMCQRCHLRLDAPRHKQTKANNLRERRDAERLLFA